MIPSVKRFFIRIVMWFSLPRARRFFIVMGMWLSFTVLMGAAAPIIPQRVAGLQNTFGIIQILSGGDLIIAGCVVAADALGRFFRCVYLFLTGVSNKMPSLWSISGPISNILCLFVLGQYSVRVVQFRSSHPTTDIPPFAYLSLWLFVATAIGAGVTVAGSEAIRKVVVRGPISRSVRARVPPEAK
jgi:hypothetical protein